MFIAIYTAYFGKVDIEAWEYWMALLYILFFYVILARIKNVRIKKEPEFRFFLFGYLAKIFGALVFSLIYYYYYQGGDTTNYFYSAMALSNLAKVNFLDYLHVLFGENSVEMRQFFTSETGYPYYFVYFETRAYMVVRIVSVLNLFSFNSFLVTTVMLASLSYFGVFRLYLTVSRYYPSLQRSLALAILFMPSSIFWGSAILKDTLTFSALCWYLHSIDNIVFRKKEVPLSWLAIVVSLFLIITIKPYIFMVLAPASLVWISYNRLSRIRSSFVRYLILPLMSAGLLVLSIYLLNNLAGFLDKFSLDKALHTIVVSQDDLRRVGSYGDGFFDLGEIDGTWMGLLSKAPKAIIAALFRPYLWESKNIVMSIAALENLVILYFVILTLFKGQIKNTLVLFIRNPLLLTFMIFTVVYAFVIGISTPNFGALVRFKIPLLPLFMSALVITNFILSHRQRVLKSGKRFDLRVYLNGEPQEKS